MMRAPSITFAIACVTIMARPAYAQVDVPPDGLSVSPTIRLVYDTNVLRQSEQFRGGDTDDLRITPGVDVTFRKQFGLHQISAVGSLGYDFYQRFDDLNRERINLLAKGDFKVTGLCYLRPSARLNFAQSNLADQGELVGNTQRTQDYSVTAQCDKPYGYYPVLTLGYLTTDNSASSRRVFDINTRSVGLGFAYSKASLGDVRLMFNYDAFRRPNHDEDSSTISGGADNYHVGIEFKRAVAPRLSWNAGLSYIHTKAQDSRVEDFSGLGYHVGANYRPWPTLSVVLDVTRSTRNQSNTGATYVLETDFSLRADGKLGSRSTVQAGASYGKRQFKGELLIDTDDLRSSDKTTALFAGYRYALRSRLNAGFELRHEWRESDLNRYRYRYTSSSLFISLQL